jgi:hypothetical protein
MTEVIYLFDLIVNTAFDFKFTDVHRMFIVAYSESVIFVVYGACGKA